MMMMNGGAISPQSVWRNSMAVAMMTMNDGAFSPPRLANRMKLAMMMTNDDITWLGCESSSLRGYYTT